MDSTPDKHTDNDKDQSLPWKTVIALIVVGLGAVGVPLEASGFYLGLGLPMGVLWPAAAVLGLVGGWMLTPARPLFGIVWGSVTAVASTGAVIGYIALWEKWFQRIQIWNIELVLPVLTGAFVGLVAGGSVNRLVYMKGADSQEGSGDI